MGDHISQTPKRGSGNSSRYGKLIKVNKNSNRLLNNRVNNRINSNSRYNRRYRGCGSNNRITGIRRISSPISNFQADQPPKANSPKNSDSSYIIYDATRQDQR